MRATQHINCVFVLLTWSSVLGQSVKADIPDDMLFACHRIAKTKSGYDPGGDVSSGDQVAYEKSVDQCLTSRGYPPQFDAGTQNEEGAEISKLLGDWHCHGQGGPFIFRVGRRLTQEQNGTIRHDVLYWRTFECNAGRAIEFNRDYNRKNPMPPSFGRLVDDKIMLTRHDPDGEIPIHREEDTLVFNESSYCKRVPWSAPEC